MAGTHEFEKFPEGARMVCLTALTIAAEGGHCYVRRFSSPVSDSAQTLPHVAARIRAWYVAGRRSALGLAGAFAFSAQVGRRKRPALLLLPLVVAEDAIETGLFR